MATTDPIRSKEQVRQLADYFLSREQYRNYVLVVLGVCTALRISDLLQLKWEDVYDDGKNRFHTHISLTEGKTGKTKTIALNHQAIQALCLYYPYRHGAYLFPSRTGASKPIGREQAWRIIRTAAREIGIEGVISCHSLRKTFGYHAWTSGEVSPVVIMDIYNHSDFEVTKRYLGIRQDDLDDAYRAMDFF